MKLFFTDLDFYIGLPEELFERATFLVNLKDHYDPDRFFEEAFKGAKKEYLERSQRCRAPLDMQNVSKRAVGLFITDKYFIKKLMQHKRIKDNTKE